MNCEVNYCIFNKNLKCGLDIMHINEYGVCEERTFVLLENEILKLLKEKQLKELDDYINE